MEPVPEPTTPTRRLFQPLPIPRPWWDRIPSTVLVLAALLMALLTVALAIPVPYAVRQPGPTVDTLGKRDGTALITISGAETYPSEGQLRLTTVSVSGSSRYRVGTLASLRAWFDSTSSVVPREVIFPEDETAQEAEERSQAQMTSSQENATAAALEALGYEVPATLTVAGVLDDGAAADALEVGDVLTEITVDAEATPLASFATLAQVLGQTPPGTEVTLGVMRDGEPTSVSLPTGDNGEGGSLLGILVDPDLDFPIEVDIGISDIGGSSAGTMFALGIMEELTPGDATGGTVIAGTGTMSLAGEVGPIGGIEQKMNGALRDGATHFLAPTDNCDEVVGRIPDGLTVVAISTLTDAWEAVEAIGRGEGDLPTCS